MRNTDQEGVATHKKFLSLRDQTIAEICRIEAEQNRPGEKDREIEREGERGSKRDHHIKKLQLRPQRTGENVRNVVDVVVVVVKATL